MVEFDLFKEAVDDNRAEGIKAIYFKTINGDPLVDKGLLEKIRYAHQTGMEKLEFNTNGMHWLKLYLDDGTIAISNGISEMLDWSDVVGQDDLTRIIKIQHLDHPTVMLPCSRTMAEVIGAVLPTGDIPDARWQCAIYNPSCYSWRHILKMSLEVIPTPEAWKLRRKLTPSILIDEFEAESANTDPAAIASAGFADGLPGAGYPINA